MECRDFFNLFFSSKFITKANWCVGRIKKKKAWCWTLTLTLTTIVDPIIFGVTGKTGNSSHIQCHVVYFIAIRTHTLAFRSLTASRMLLIYLYWLIAAHQAAKILRQQQLYCAKFNTAKSLAVIQTSQSCCFCIERMCFFLLFFLTYWCLCVLCSEP